MPYDPEIFGAPSVNKADADIFKDLPASSPSEPSPEPPSKPDRLTPEQRAQWDAVMKNGWGTGAPKFAYDLGGKVTDATGSPLLGATVSAIPSALEMALGGQVGPAASPVLEVGARKLMQSALKPTLTEIRKGRAAPAVETMLEEGFNPTAGGVEKMRDTVSQLSDQVKQAVSKSGAQIDTRAVADAVPNALDRFKNGPLARQAVEDLGKVQAEFLEHPNVLGSRTIPVQVAQDLKTGYQRAVGDKGYGELKTPITEGEKQVARALREQIGQAVPSVQGPLARESNIITALKLAERRAAMDANKNPVGLGWLGQPWMIPFWMWDRSAAAKALTARALYQGSNHLPGSVGALYGAMHGGALYPPSY